MQCTINILGTFRGEEHVLKTVLGKSFLKECACKKEGNKVRYKLQLFYIVEICVQLLYFHSKKTQTHTRPKFVVSAAAQTEAKLFLHSLLEEYVCVLPAHVNKRGWKGMWSQPPQIKKRPTCMRVCLSGVTGTQMRGRGKKKGDFVKGRK